MPIIVLINGYPILNVCFTSIVANQYRYVSYRKKLFLFCTIENTVNSQAIYLQLQTKRWGKSFELCFGFV